MPKQSGPTLTQRVNEHEERFARCDARRAELADRINQLERMAGLAPPVPPSPAGVGSFGPPVPVEPEAETERGATD